MTGPSDWIEEAIDKSHDRASFDCGEPALNDYLKRYARQNHAADLSKTFVAVGRGDRRILGYYTLCPTAVAQDLAPLDLRRGAGRHDLPGYLLARLAIERTEQSKGLGGALFIAAVRRCILAARDMGGTIMVIDAKNERAAAWYAGYGALPSADQPLTLILPLAAFADELLQSGKI